MVDRKTSINITCLTVIIFGCLLIFTVRVRVRAWVCGSCVYAVCALSWSKKNEMFYGLNKKIETKQRWSTQPWFLQYILFTSHPIQMTNSKCCHLIDFKCTPNNRKLLIPFKIEYVLFNWSYSIYIYRSSWSLIRLCHLVSVVLCAQLL